MAHLAVLVIIGVIIWWASLLNGGLKKVGVHWVLRALYCLILVALAGAMFWLVW